MPGEGLAPPWPELPQAEARALAPDELRLLWFPARTDEAPRRQRIDELLRGALAPLLAREPAALRFAREAKGRPFLAYEGAPDFNLSDTTGGTLLALSHGARAACRRDRKSTRLNSSHLGISYAVFCLKKKKRI